jgi:hypothetical protein
VHSVGVLCPVDSRIYQSLSVLLCARPDGSTAPPAAAALQFANEVSALGVSSLMK